MILFTPVDDRDPKKLLLCARDVLTGIILPWHLGEDHRVAIDGIRAQLEKAVEDRVGDDVIVKLLDEAVVVAAQIAETSKSMLKVHDKMDRARLTLSCIRASHQKS